MSPNAIATDGSAHAERQAWMALLARARPEELERPLAELSPAPSYSRLRGPESGLYMLRGRMGGTGQAFNFGEATVTRCTVEIESGAIGHAYVLGTDRRCAELAAVCDAMMQEPARATIVRQRVLEPIDRRLKAEEARRAAEHQSTRVEFFTMVRGEG